MKTINMKKGFTMIELVFVIVIIGILSAVALPKFLETSNQAHDAAVRSFVGTLNRTTGPTMWAKSLADPAMATAGTKGQVATYCGDLTGTAASKYIALPDELTDDGSCGFTAKTGSGATLGASFADGDATKAPVWTIINP